MNMKCPNCGGSLVYDIASDSMKCSYCGQSISKEKPSLSFTKEPEYMEMNIYHCPSCGADLMVGQTQASTFCSYCGSPSIVYDRVSKEVKPSKIIPFKLSEGQALACIKDRFGHGRYIPPQIRKLTTEKIHAIYIPYWLYTAYIRKDVTLSINSDNAKHTYYRDVSCTYHNIPMDASLRLSNDLSHRIEPYYMNELEDFNVNYLSGFYADKYDVPYTTLQPYIKSRCNKFIDSGIEASCPTSVQVPNRKETINNEEYELQDVTYALLPAYFVNIQYKSGTQLIIVNGQTGNVVGNIPVETSQIMRKFIKNFFISWGVLSFFSTLFLSVPYLQIMFIFPIIFILICLYNGIKQYKNYQLGMMQLSSQHMTSYTNRMED